MNKLFLRTSMFAVAALFAQAAMADGNFKVRAGVASTDYKLDVTTASGTNGALTSKYSATNLGLTYVTAAGIYFDLSGSSGSGDHDLYTTPQSFKRTDQAFIVGLPLGSASVYIGYKNGTTDISAPPSLAPFTKDTFTAKGLIMGGGAGFPLGEDGRAGNIGVTAGIGLMKADWKEDGNFPLNISADTAVGFSFGASYTYPITPSFGVTADYKYNGYNYDFTSSNGGSTFKIDEKISALGITLYAKF